MTIKLSSKLDKVLTGLADNKDLDFTTKAEIIRKSIYVYDYLIRKHNEGFNIVGLSDDGEVMHDYNALFEI